MDTDVSEEPSLHLPDTIVWRQQVAPKPWHIPTELHAALCHKAVPCGSLNDLFSTSQREFMERSVINWKEEMIKGGRVI